MNQLLLALALLSSLSASAGEKATLRSMLSADGSHSEKVVEVSGKPYATYIATTGSFAKVFGFLACRDAKTKGISAALDLCQKNGGKICRLSLTEKLDMSDKIRRWAGTFVAYCNATAYVIDLAHPLDDRNPVSLIQDTAPFHPL